MKNIKIVLLLVAVAVLPMAGLSQNDAAAVSQLQKFTQFYRYLNSSYVDTINNRELIEKAMQEVLAQLDPHSTYITADDMKGVREVFDGSFSGIGIEFNVLHDTIFVVNVISGGPSEAVGLLPNDRIVTVNGESVVGTKITDVPGILRGPKGSRVELGVVRARAGKMLDFSIVRDNIPIHTVDAAYKVDNNTGYIRINRFANNTYSEFLEAYQKFGKIDALIVDVRSNGGGLLDQAIELSNFFLPRGAEIVSTEGLRVAPERVTAMRNGQFLNGKVIILTNETSASGSEILAGAIQDWDRGLIIGRQTFGKGLVQRQYPFSDGSAMRLTIARYHTPSGRVIQRPYERGNKDEYQLDLIRRINADSTVMLVDSTQVYHTLKTGRTVYGGGGITPDIMVERDTTAYTDYWGSLIRNGVLLEYVITYMDNNRAELNRRYPTVEKFQREFTVDQSTLDALVAAATEKNIEFNAEQFAESRRMISTQLKALIAQKLWGMNEYFLISNAEDDEIFAKALEVLNNWDRYSNGIISSQ